MYSKSTIFLVFQIFWTYSNVIIQVFQTNNWSHCSNYEVLLKKQPEVEGKYTEYIIENVINILVKSKFIYGS